MQCLEALTGIKINLSKTELFPINIDADLKNEAAALFGCKIGKFPFIYLGLHFILGN